MLLGRASLAFLFLGCASSFAPKNRAELTEAVEEWLSHDATAFQKFGDISQWDVSQVRDMGNLFKGAKGAIGDLSKWNVSGVEKMNGMFQDASYFSGDLSKWDVSKVNDMNHMFDHAAAFNGDLSLWDVSKVRDMRSMFEHASSFKGDLSKWRVSKVQKMNQMFLGALEFNSDLNKWDVSRVEEMNNMFDHAASFSGTLSAWDVSNVGDMRGMFAYATSFKGDLSKWDVSRVQEHTESMFSGDSCSICVHVAAGLQESCRQSCVGAPKVPASTTVAEPEPVSSNSLTCIDFGEPCEPNTWKPWGKCCQKFAAAPQVCCDLGPDPTRPGHPHSVVCAFENECPRKSVGFMAVRV